MAYRYVDNTTSSYYNNHQRDPPSLYRHHRGYSSNNTYPQHYHHQQQAYYNHIRKQSSLSQHPHLTRSLSTGTTTNNNQYYDEQERFYREYGWYYHPAEIQQHVPQQHYTHQQRKSKNRSRSNSRAEYFDEDGEPLTELEILALENAARNERESKIRIVDENDGFDDNKEIEEQPKLVVDEVIEGDDLSSVMESLTMVNSSSTLSIMVDDDQSGSSTNTNTITPSNSSAVDSKLQKIATAQSSSKKKRWPFSFLFKRNDHQPTPTKSSSTPPTPVLSPDNNSSLYTSTMTTSSSSSSPFELADNHQNSEVKGSWAFKYPTPVPMTPTVWIRFDNENQKKMRDYIVKSKSHTFIEDDVVQFTDSHICGGKLPIAVVPVQMRCYIPTDITANQIATFELNFIPDKR